MSTDAISRPMASNMSFDIPEGPMSSIYVFTGHHSVSPTPSTIPDDSDQELDDARETEDDYVDTDVDDENEDDTEEDTDIDAEDDTEEDEDEEMDDDFTSAHKALEQLGLSDTEMADESDDNDDNVERLPTPPPHFTSPLYEAWLQGLTPNILFRVRIKPLIPASAISAHTIRLWYRDFGSQQALLEHVVKEYQLMGTEDVSGYILKERKSNTWVEFGFDGWDEVMSRIRRRMSDEGQGIGVAVQAQLVVLVGGDEDVVGITKKGDLSPILASEEDPDL
ncbi:hypothetical protein BZA77DRAFT_315106 [Pyronema omphalodes]|nr:hypothetical protein BZA77DRAFT_315106 [Pyronema omphalodes]